MYMYTHVKYILIHACIYISKIYMYIYAHQVSRKARMHIVLPNCAFKLLPYLHCPITNSAA